MSFDDIDAADEADDTPIEDTYLIFRVGAEEYAVPVTSVTEIVRLQKSFAVPDVPSCVRGVINLRGKVIPLVDVRQRFCDERRRDTGPAPVQQVAEE
jgi:purine-binding chemotaxis protein CheW